MCEYCSKGENCNEEILSGALKIEKMELIGMQIYLDNDQLYLFVDDARYGREIKTINTRIKYCPMCGKKLEGEA